MKTRAGHPLRRAARTPSPRRRGSSACLRRASGNWARGYQRHLPDSPARRRTADRHRRSRRQRLYPSIPFIGLAEGFVVARVPPGRRQPPAHPQGGRCARTRGRASSTRSRRSGSSPTGPASSSTTPSDEGDERAAHPRRHAAARVLRRRRRASTSSLIDATARTVGRSSLVSPTDVPSDRGRRSAAWRSVSRSSSTEASVSRTSSSRIDAGDERSRDVARGLRCPGRRTSKPFSVPSSD